MREDYQKAQQAYKAELREYDFKPYTNSELAQLHLDMLGGDKRAHEALWMHGVRMVEKIVKKMAALGQIQPYQVDDARQEGNLAIGVDLPNWSSNRGRYSTFMWICIRSAISRFIESESRQGFTGEGAETLEVGHLGVRAVGRLSSDLVHESAPSLEELVMNVADLEAAMICSLTDKEQDVIERYYILDQNDVEQSEEKEVDRSSITRTRQRAIAKLQEYFRE